MYMKQPRHNYSGRAVKTNIILDEKLKTRESADHTFVLAKRFQDIRRVQESRYATGRPPQMICIAWSQRVQPNLKSLNPEIHN